MCFAPQRHALFRHLNLQKWSDAMSVFCTFWLGNVLRATTVCTQHLNCQKWSERGVILYILTWKCASRHNGVHFFNISTAKVVRTWCVLYILTWKCASAPHGVQFFISHLASWLRTRRFSEPTFRPPEPQIIRQTQCFATFLPFRASASSFFWLFLFYPSFF